jgi:hypothetical protein
MSFRLDESVRILNSTPLVFRAQLATLPEEWLHASEGPETFSAIDVLGHLIFGEQTDWIPRARIILECGEARPFDPFDRRGFLPLLEGRSVADLLGMFADLRAQNLEALESLHLGEAELDLTGTHPALGRVTMRNLIAAWAVHDLGHTAQVTRVLASRYHADVGPWVKYMSILHPPPSGSE